MRGRNNRLTSALLEQVSTRLRNIQGNRFAREQCIYETDIVLGGSKFESQLPSQGFIFLFEHSLSFGFPGQIFLEVAKLDLQSFPVPLLVLSILSCCGRLRLKLNATCPYPFLFNLTINCHSLDEEVSLFLGVHLHVSGNLGYSHHDFMVIGNVLLMVKQPLQLCPSIDRVPGQKVTVSIIEHLNILLSYLLDSVQIRLQLVHKVRSLL